MQISNPAFNKGFQDYDLIQVNVVPQNSYEMPTTEVSATSRKDASGNLVVNFSAKASADATTEVKAVRWDFGDSQEADGFTVTNTYQPFAEQQLVVARVTDKNGVFNDTSWKLDTQGNLTKNAVNYKGATVAENKSSVLIILIVIAGLVFLGSAVAIWKLRN